MSNFNSSKIKEMIGEWSLNLAVKENGFSALIEKLRKIKSDLSEQYSRKTGYNSYWELKIRGVHAFQCSLMIKALEKLKKEKITVVDIGDSAGTHMIYLKELTKNNQELRTVSVNLDPRAVDKIRSQGLEAIHCRAEEITAKKDISADLFVSFETVEHLHNPALFFHRLAEKTQTRAMVVTVPYLRRSRVGLHNLRLGMKREVFAEDEHIFEFNPEDWALLLLHSGWKVMHSQTYFQYPRRFPGLNNIFSWFWRKTDFEGFWGVILEKDSSYSDLYKDWED